ncbi:folate-binding protein YgfZ [soil metagenome]
MKAAFLPDRGVVRVSGDDARAFLDGLVTTNVELVKPGIGRFGALLTPQGKIIVDFLVTEAPEAHGGGFVFDCPLVLAQALTDRLGFYKLRAKVTVDNLSSQLGVLVAWGGTPATTPDLAFEDPRDPQLGWRIFVPDDLVDETAAAINAEITESEAYEAHRIACGVPRGGVDFIYSDAFPHETNMDRLHGVDFDKGCYVGQEVVSRMEHRGTARTRTVRIRLDGSMPDIGLPVNAGDKPVGTMGSSANGVGLALLRTDRVSDALEAGLALTAGGLPISLVSPDDVKAAPKKASA